MTASSSSVSKAASKTLSKVEATALGASHSHDKSTSKTTDQPASEPIVKSERPTSTTKKPAGKAASTKRENSDIFKSFSKSKPKIERRDTESSVDTTPALVTPVSVGSSMNSHIQNLNRGYRRFRAILKMVGYPAAALSHSLPV